MVCLSRKRLQIVLKRKHTGPVVDWHLAVNKQGSNSKYSYIHYMIFSNLFLLLIRCINSFSVLFYFLMPYQASTFFPLSLQDCTVKTSFLYKILPRLSLRDTLVLTICSCSKLQSHVLFCFFFSFFAPLFVGWMDMPSFYSDHCTKLVCFWSRRWMTKEKKHGDAFPSFRVQIFRVTIHSW